MTLKIESREELLPGCTRYHLSNGWLVYHARGRGRPVQFHRYEVFTPEGPHAAFLGGSDTLKGALEVATARQQAADANLARMAFGEEYR